MTDEDAKRLSEIREALSRVLEPPHPLQSALRFFLRLLDEATAERDALEEAANSVCFHWFDCLHGQCGHLDEAMEKLQAASQKRQRYRRAVGDDAIPPPALQWQPIETPPPTQGRSSVRVLGVLSDGSHVFAHYTPFYLGHPEESGMLWISEGFVEKPTDWMPLPAPPQRPDASKEADGPSRRLDDTTNARTGPEPMP